MLLSLPTWIVHLLTVSEWFAAMLLFERYGRAIASPGLRLFALCMLPHLLGGLAILVFHASGDRWDGALAAARVLTYGGSLLLLAATLSMLPLRSARWSARLLLAAGLAWALLRTTASAQGAAALLPATNGLYLAFLVALLLVRRADRRLFSRLSLAGFWFLLVFVAVTIASTRLAVGRWGLPSLSHADVLHGASEALLSLSNLMIALGAYRRLRAVAPQPQRARTERALWGRSAR